MKLRKPKSIKIIGPESLDEVIEGIILLDDIIEKNKQRYKEAWPTWLPPENVIPPQNGIYEDGKGRMAYIPIPTKRKCPNEEFEGRIKDAPYWIFILNQPRESRPKSSDKKNRKKDKKQEGHCKLCKNILEKRMIISKIDNFYLTPNGFPYDLYSSLLIYKGIDKKQGDISPEDIATWMKASILLDQFVFYNSPKAGASLMEHHHAQMVDPFEMKINNKITPYPIFNPAFVGRELVNGRPDVFRITGYPIEALIFTGSDAPKKVYDIVDSLKKDGRAYNILVNKNEVFVIGRNKENERSICIRRNVGGLEICGVFFMGDIEERSGGYKIKMQGSKIFTNMDYYTAGRNSIRATIRSLITYL